MPTVDLTPDELRAIKAALQPTFTAELLRADADDRYGAPASPASTAFVKIAAACATGDDARDDRGMPPTA